jgi:hypothetical protein
MSLPPDAVFFCMPYYLDNTSRKFMIDCRVVSNDIFMSFGRFLSLK